MLSATRLPTSGVFARTSQSNFDWPYKDNNSDRKCVRSNSIPYVCCNIISVSLEIFQGRLHTHKAPCLSSLHCALEPPPASTLTLCQHVLQVGFFAAPVSFSEIRWVKFCISQGAFFTLQQHSSRYSYSPVGYWTAKAENLTISQLAFPFFKKRQRVFPQTE